MIKNLQEKLHQGILNNQKIQKFALVLDGNLSVKYAESSRFKTF